MSYHNYDVPGIRIKTKQDIKDLDIFCEEKPTNDEGE